MSCRDGLENVRSGVAHALYARRTGLRCVRARGLPAADSAKPGKYAQILLSDIGTGVEAATLDHLFEPFSISFFISKEVAKSTALGLAIVYGLVEQHRGFVTVYSEPGQRSA